MLQNIAALPQPLLEKIIICCTGTEDKKALRQTCKYFQKILDDKPICIKLWRMERLKRLQFEQTFMKGMRHWQNLKAVHFQTTLNITMLLKHLPSTLTTLRCSTNDVKELSKVTVPNKSLPRWSLGRSYRDGAHLWADTPAL